MSNPTEVQSKANAVSSIIEGRVVDDTRRVEVCVKGTVLGFPATIEAIKTGFPFGVTYYIETKVIDDPGVQPDPNALKMTIFPRYAKGFMGFFARILLFESSGMKVNDKKFDSIFISQFNDRHEAERFVKYPSVMDKLLHLQRYTQFTELIIRANAGVCLSQPKSFKSLDLDVCRDTFQQLGEIGQVLFESFS